MTGTNKQKNSQCIFPPNIISARNFCKQFPTQHFHLTCCEWKLTLWAPGSSSPGGFFLSTYFFFERVWIRKVGFDWPALRRKQLSRLSCLKKLRSIMQCSLAATQRREIHFNTCGSSTCCWCLTCTAWQRASRCSIRSSLPTGNSKVSQRQTCAEAALVLSCRPCLSLMSG